MSEIKQKMERLREGQRVRIEAFDGISTGTIRTIDRDRLMLHLDDVEDEASKYKYKSTQHISLANARSVTILHNPIDESEPILPFSPECESLTNSKKMEIDDSESILTFPPEYESLTNSKIVEKTHAEKLRKFVVSSEVKHDQERLTHFVLIERRDERYANAIAHIKLLREISLIVEPSNSMREQRISVVGIGTQKTIYIFDIIGLGGDIPEDLKMCLQSKNPIKIVHNSHGICEQLRFNHKIALGRIVDTFSLYCNLSGEKQSRSLKELVELVLNVPDTNCEENEAAQLEPSQNRYAQRPLSCDVQKYLAKLALSQLKLYHYLLHERILSKFYEQCNLFTEDDTNEFPENMFSLEG